MWWLSRYTITNKSRPGRGEADLEIQQIQEIEKRTINDILKKIKGENGKINKK